MSLALCLHLDSAETTRHAPPADFSYFLILRYNPVFSLHQHKALKLRSTLNKLVNTWNSTAWGEHNSNNSNSNNTLSIENDFLFFFAPFSLSISVNK